MCSLLGNVQAVIGSAQARMRVEGGSGRQEPPRAPLSILGFGGKPLVSTNKTINPSDLIDVLFEMKGSLMSVQPDVQLNWPPAQKVQHHASTVQYSVKFKTSVLCGDIRCVVISDVW